MSDCHYFSFRVQKHWNQCWHASSPTIPQNLQKNKGPPVFFSCWQKTARVGLTSHKTPSPKNSWHPQLGSMAAPAMILPGNQGWPPQKGGSFFSELIERHPDAAIGGNPVQKPIDLLIDVFTSFLFYLSLPGNINGQNHQKTIGLQIENVLRKSHPPPHWLAKAHSFEKAAITKKAFVETGSSFADLTIWKLRFFGPKFWWRIYSGLPCWPSHRQIQTDKCLSIQKVPGQAKAEKILSCKIFIPFKSVKHEDAFFSWSMILPCFDEA